MLVTSKIPNSTFFKKRKKQEGMAMFEMIPIIVVVLLLMNFSIGFFGVIHTGILNSIGARNYAFETFRHRSNLTYFSTFNQLNAEIQFSKDQQRQHTTLTENESSGNGYVVATARKIDFFQNAQNLNLSSEVMGSKDDHNNETLKVIEQKRFEGNGVNPVWIKTAYGICLNATCGG